MKDLFVIITAAGLVAAVGLALTKKKPAGAAIVKPGQGGSPDRTLTGAADLSGTIDTDEGRYWLDTAGNAVYFQAWGVGAAP